MTQSVLALIIDYKTTTDAVDLSLQLKQEGSPYPIQVVHVDNGNFPPVSLSPEQKEAGVELLATGKNLGYAGALNFAIRHFSEQGLHYTAYWFLNSDLILEKNSLNLLMETFIQNPRIGAIGPIVRFFPQKNKVWGARGKVSPLLGTTAMTGWSQGGILPRWSYIPGCSLLARPEAYQAVGGLPEKYKLYYEETDFCIQLQKKGWELWVEEKATVYHKVDSLKAGIPARHFAYYFTRNNLAFWKNCFGIPLWLQLPRTFYVAFREILLPLRRAKTWTEVKDRLSYALAGIKDGIAFAQGTPLQFEQKLFPPEIPRDLPKRLK